ncbi:acid-sensing ion channel 4-B-like [Ylistrum balloti]|uniref:acid-sensing ion channel 4-B-like n=1 Tax=Ylistrum balloti TaxID=509963 RepID=UPI002905B55B|nr:acid-sensing ion channel 4-B-like [Ylistrum balloti]
MVLKHQIGDSSVLEKPEDSGCKCNNDKDIKDGLFNVWHNYSSSTTLHCLSRAAKVESSLMRRFVWYVFLAAMFGLLLWQCYTQISRYLQRETILNEHSALNEDRVFPSLTICDVNNVKKSNVQNPQVQEVLTKTYMESATNKSYFNHLDVNWLRSINVSDIFYNHSVFDMFLLCTWEKKPIPCSSIFIQRVTSAGICATHKGMVLSESGGVGSGNGLVVILHSNISDYLVTSRAGAGFRVLLHTHNEEPDVEEHGFALSPGTASIIAVTKYQRFPIPAFGDDFCVDTTASDYVHQLKYISKYSYGACVTDCFTAFVQEICGCRDVFMPGDIPVCNIDQRINCFEAAEVSFISNSSCECGNPCEEISYLPEVSYGSFPYPGYLTTTFPDIQVSEEYMKSNGLMFEVFMKSDMYIQRKQILEFTEADLVAAVGGYMGLFIGASIGTIMELLEFFCDLMMNLSKKLKARTHDIKKK